MGVLDRQSGESRVRQPAKSGQQSGFGSFPSAGSFTASGDSLTASAALTEKMTEGLDDLLAEKAENRILGADQYIRNTVYQHLFDIPRGAAISVREPTAGETAAYEAKGGSYHTFESSTGEILDPTCLTEKICGTLRSTDEIRVYEPDEAGVAMGRETAEQLRARRMRQQQEQANRIRIYEGLSDSPRISRLSVGGTAISEDGQIWRKTRAAQEMTYSDYAEEYGEPEEEPDCCGDGTVHVDSEYLNPATGRRREVPGRFEEENRIAGKRVRVYSQYIREAPGQRQAGKAEEGTKEPGRRYPA